MAIACPRCQRMLEYSKDPPLFCAYCGQRLNTAADLPTGEYIPKAGASAATVPVQIDFPSNKPEPPPTKVGNFRIIRFLGAGGMGTVYEAEHIDSREKVAVKLLSAQLATSSTSIERFRQEGRLAGQITHPRCVFVLGADTEGDRPYIVMELMPGTTLKDIVDKSGPLEPQQAIAAILDVIDGLQEAHRLGVLHRDVKPSNCFLMPDGSVKIGDFGLSKSLATNNNLTQSGAFLGTVLYASPEQIRGEPVDFASDVYSVCATIYCLLTGQAPFQHESATAALAKAISEPARPLRELRPDVPRSLERIVLRGLERDRSRRWQSLAELRTALVALVPAKQTLSGVSIRAGAYLIDELIVRALVIAALAIWFRSFGSAFTWLNSVALIAFPIYFLLMEWQTGASIGKRLFRLRVNPTNSTDPPSFAQAFLRTLIFYCLITLPLMKPREMIEHLKAEVVGLPLLNAAIPFLIGGALLIAPMRRRNDYRGLHEWLSGTCTRQLPRIVPPVRLFSRYPQRLDNLPRRPDEVPSPIGAFRILNATPARADGSRVLLGEDTILGRRVLLTIRPLEAGTENESEARRNISRSTRLRFLNSGTTTIEGSTVRWQAFVAPSGAPLTDIVVPGDSLRWGTTRSILAQLAEELQRALHEGTLPESLTVEQVWVQQEGRIQLVDVPLSATPPKSTEPSESQALKLLRDCAVTALEGAPRESQTSEDTTIRAALPLHAERLLRRLSGKNRFSSVSEFVAALDLKRNQPTEISQGLRTFQLLLQAVLHSIGLMTMFLASGLFSVMAILQHEEFITAAEQLRQEIAAADVRGRCLQAHPEFAADLADPIRFQERLRKLIAGDQRKILVWEENLSFAERMVLQRLRDLFASPPAPGSEKPGTRVTKLTDYPLEQRCLHVVLHLREQEASDEEDVDAWSAAVEAVAPGDWRSAVVVLLLWPIIWGVGAFLLRGGISFALLGIRIVRVRDGRRALRRQCFLRVLLLWLPPAVLLSASVWCQSKVLTEPALHASLWWGAVLVILLVTTRTIAHPDRTYADRLLGTVLVPA